MIFMRELLLILFGLAYVTLVDCQYVAKVTYECRTNIVRGREYDGQNTLYFVPGRSLYVHDNYPSKNEYIRNEASVHIIYGDAEKHAVYMNYQADSMVFKNAFRAGRGIRIIHDSIPVIDWKMTNEEMEIMGFRCLKATAEFGGRTYNAWYTPDVPVPYGPYMLNGLPGLIVKAYSYDDRVSYQLTSFDPAFGVESIDQLIHPPTDGIHVTYEDIRQDMIDFYRSSLTKSWRHGDPSPNWDIIYGYYNIIEPYKAEQEAKKKKK